MPSTSATELMYMGWLVPSSKIGLSNRYIHPLIQTILGDAETVFMHRDALPDIEWLLILKNDIWIKWKWNLNFAGISFPTSI